MKLSNKIFEIPVLLKSKCIELNKNGKSSEKKLFGFLSLKVLFSN